MSKYQLTNSLKLSSFDLENNRKMIISWSIAMFSFMFLYMILFPSIQEIAQVKMDAMPKELLEFVGMDNFTDMNNFVSYFGMIFNLALIAISFFAVTFGANLFLKEEKNKTIEFLSSLEVNRTEIYIAKLLTAFVAVISVLLASMIAVLICGVINGGENFSDIEVFIIVKMAGFTPFFFMALGLCLSAVSAKIGASVIGSMAVIFSYMSGYLGNILGEKALWLQYLSPFELFQPEHAQSPDGTILMALAVYIVLMFGMWIIGAMIYKRRDFVV